MSQKAYVLIELRISKVDEAVEVLRALPGVVSVDKVTGPYDAIATLKAANHQEIGEIITGGLQSVRGISRTVTCFVV